MKRPKTLGAAELCGDEKELAIYINADRIGGSIVYVSPHYARQIGQRLIDMAEYVEYVTRKKGK